MFCNLNLLRVVLLHYARKPNTSNYSIAITGTFILSFILLRHLVHEAHEFAHMISGWTFNGAWGTRDFNNVQPFTESIKPSIMAVVITGLAGPMVNFLLCWIGAFIIIKARSIKQIALGSVLIFACLPFARIFTILMGGGDELGVLRLFIHEPMLARTIALVAVLAIFIYPLYLSILPAGRRLIIFSCFLLIPMIVEGTIVLGLFNSLLNKGILAEGNYFGAPLLVIIVLMTCLLLLPFFIKHLSTFLAIKQLNINKTIYLLRRLVFYKM